MFGIEERFASYVKLENEGKFDTGEGRCIGKEMSEMGKKFAS